MFEINAVVWLFLFSKSVMVCVGNWQIQIIFTQSSQYRAQIFVYAKHRLYVRYVHGRNLARNLWMAAMYIF